MNLYLLNAVEGGRRIELATCDTAALTLMRFRDALSRYERVWVTDQRGDDVSENDLTSAARREVDLA